VHGLPEPSEKPPTEQEPDRFEEVTALLRAARGMDFTGYKPSTLRRRLARRMLVSRASSLDEYIEYLHSHSEELDALYDDFLITVTEFFRDSDTFDVLRAEVLPAMLRDKLPGEPLRLWIPGWPPMSSGAAAGRDAGRRK
jgi:two-component system CheB/CheR fusion protein